MAEKELKYKLSLFDKDFTKKLREAGFNVEKLDKQMNKMAQKNRGGTGTGAVAGGSLIAGAISSATSAVIGFGRESVDVLAKYENFEARMTTSLGNRAAAQMQMNKITQDAAKTPFDVGSLVESNAMLISAGESADGARKTTLDLGNAIAATGGGADELSRMAVNMQQIKSLGKASALDVKQFAFAGIPIYNLLAKSMGKSVKQLKDMEISYEDLTKALSDARKEGGMFFHGLENGMQTVGGKISNFGDAWEQLQKNFGESNRGMIASSLDWANALLNDINKVMAAENALDKNMEKIGASSSFSEKMEGKARSVVEGLFNSSNVFKLFGAKDLKFSDTDYEKMTQGQMKIDEFVVKEGYSNAQKQKGLQFMMLEDQKRFNKLSAEEKVKQLDAFKAKQQGLVSASGMLQGSIIADNSKREDIATDKKLGGKAGLGTGSGSSSLGSREVTSNRPQSLIININDGLVKQLNIYATTLQESGKKVREEISKVLLEAVGDANNVAKT